MLEHRASREIREALVERRMNGMQHTVHIFHRDPYSFHIHSKWCLALVFQGECFDLSNRQQRPDKQFCF